MSPTRKRGKARMVRIYTFENLCARCGHKWTSEGEAPPRHCAKCKARGWEKAARPYRRKA